MAEVTEVVVQRYKDGDRPVFAIALTKGSVDLHCGCIYAPRDRSPGLWHLAFHKDCRHGKPNGHWAWVVCSADEVEQSLVANYCAEMATRPMPQIKYSFKMDDPQLDLEGESGLTCATFVLKFLKRIGMDLVLSSWPVGRVGDIPAQKALVAMLAEEDADHAAAEAAHVGTVARVRPEEIAAASAMSDHPVDFSRLQPVALHVRKLLRDLGFNIEADPDSPPVVDVAPAAG